QAFVHKLFTGIKVIGCYQFRVTRNSDLFVDEEEIDDLRRALEGELAQRRYGAAVRLETSSDCPQDMVMFLQGQFASHGLDPYRAGHASPLVDALVAAAHAGKDVTVIVELRARFDEEANIELSNRLQEAGAHVMYGVVGYKTHAKLTLIVRREAGGIRRYCHLGTGNYHPRTARHYTDYGLFTCDDEIGQDVHEVFLQLTSLTQTPKLNRLTQSPFGMHEMVLSKLAREAEHARARRAARIIVKMNALVD